MSKTALITGASSGIGAEFARQLASRGYNLILTGRRENLLDELCKELMQKNKINSEYLLVELTDPEEVKLLEEKISKTEELEILVNNAGFGIEGNFVNTDTDEIIKMMTVHNTIPVRLIKAALTIMLKKNKGYIINVSSAASFLLTPGSVVYCASKLFLNSFTESLHLELFNTNIRIQALCPGFTLTDFHTKIGYKKDSPVFKKFYSAEFVVKQSLLDLEENKVISIPGFKYNLLKLVYFIPRKLFYKIILLANKVYSSKH